MSVSVQNPEEAATIASEFIYSVDNLPNEVTHLLQEIKHKDIRAQELQQEIEKDSAKYVRHSLRASSSSSAPSSPSSSAPSLRSSLFPAKIAASYAEIEQLSTEKCILAQNLTDLITRTRARLDADLVKVRILQGEVVEYPSGPGKVAAVTPGTDGYAVTGRNPAVQVGESLRNAMANASMSDVRQVSATPPATSALSTAGPNTQKKRRLNAASIKLTPAASPTKHRSASPTTTGTATTHTHQRSRLSRQIHPREEPEVEPEVEDDGDGEDGDAEDERLYCFCQKQSYGDMIACDNEGECPYEWFHLTCVGMKQPTPEKWYCSVCESKGAGSTVARKGRKK